MKQLEIEGMEGQGLTTVNRRSFVKGAAAACAGLAAAGPTLRALRVDEARAATGLAQGKWSSSCCVGCTSWCSKQVYVVNGRAIKIRGNPHSRTNGINSCPRAHLSLQQVYDPDRVKTPMKRTNPRKGRDEDPGFVPISWDEALDMLADRIMELRQNNETHKFLVMRGRYTYLRDLIYDRMPKIIGSPNNISHSSICAEAEKMRYFQEGQWAYMQYDIPHTRYVILWGADPLVANRGVSSYLNSWGSALDNAKIASVEPRLSGTGSKCDEWLPVKPGHDGALATAMAHLILVEGMWYKPFVGDFFDGVNRFVPGQEVDEYTFMEEHTHGLVKWWNLVLKDATPEWAAPLCGIPVDQIRRVALGFAEAAPNCMSWVGGGPAMQPRGTYGCLAANALNGLAGGCDNVGGVLKYNSRSYQSFPSPKDFMDDIAQAGVKHEKIDQRGRLEWPNLKKSKSGGGVNTNNAADGIINEDPNEIKVAVGYFNNYPFSCSGGQRWYTAMSKVDFFAHLTTHASEMSWFANVVLPVNHVMYESWGVLDNASNGYRAVSLMQPAIEPVWNTKGMETEIPFLLAEKLAQKGFDNLQRYYKSIVDPETGKSPENSKEFELYAIKHTTRNFWDPARSKGGDTFSGWDEFVKVGVWNSDPYPYRARWSNMGTKTGKFEFYSETLKEALEKHAEKHNTTVDHVLEVCNYLARGELAFVPHYEEPFKWGDPAEYPFKFVDYKARLNREGRSANCPWYLQLKDLDPGDVAYEDVAKLNPIDGERLGIQTGDKIRVTSPTGGIECIAALWEGTQPGTVAKCFGQGHWAYGRYAAKRFGKEARGANNNYIIPVDNDRLSGSSAYYGHIRVKVEKV